MRVIPLLVTIGLAVMPVAARAQASENNAAGVYAAPVLYGFSHGSEYQLATSGGGLDIGAYYSRFFTPRWSMRIEARFGSRALDDAIRVSDPLIGWARVRVSEAFVQFPLMVERSDRLLVDDHELRISTGFGAAVSYVISQDLLVPGGTSTWFTPADSYGRAGFVVDGGVAFRVVRTTSVFLRFNLAVDLWSFAEPDDADVIRRFWSTGFCAGYEYGF